VGVKDPGASSGAFRAGMALYEFFRPFRAWRNCCDNLGRRSFLALPQAGLSRAFGPWSEKAEASFKYDYRVDAHNRYI